MGILLWQLVFRQLSYLDCNLLTLLLLNIGCVARLEDDTFPSGLFLEKVDLLYLNLMRSMILVGGFHFTTSTTGEVNSSVNRVLHRIVPTD